MHVLRGEEECFSGGGLGIWGRGAYTAPLMNIIDTPAFSLRVRPKRQTIGSGKTKMMRSEIIFMAP